MAHAGGSAAIRSSFMDLWSIYSIQVQLSTVVGNKVLPSITIAGLPIGAVVTRAVMLIKARIIENTNALVNSINGFQNIQMQKTAGGVWITGIPFVGGEMSVPGSIRESGDVLIGSQDVSSQVPVNGALVSFQWALALSSQNNLNFNDLQVGLRIWYNA